MSNKLNSHTMRSLRLYFNTAHWVMDLPVLIPVGHERVRFGARRLAAAPAWSRRLAAAASAGRRQLAPNSPQAYRNRVPRPQVSRAVLYRAVLLALATVHAWNDCAFPDMWAITWSTRLNHHHHHHTSTTTPPPHNRHQQLATTSTAYHLHHHHTTTTTPQASASPSRTPRRR